MRSIAIAMSAVAVAACLGLAGCGGADKASNADGPAQQPQAQSQKAAKAKDFDGSGMEERGDIGFVLATPGGTTEGGAVPKVVLDPKGMSVVEARISNGSGEIYTLYLDGMESKKGNATYLVQDMVGVEGDAAKAGMHDVELVIKDGDEVVVYKKAQYEAVN